MKKLKFILALFSVILLCALPITIAAHSGRTDGKGGHYNRSTGEYHYHRGYSAHDHYDINGDGIIDCPYEFEDELVSNKYGFDNDSDSSDLDLGTIIGAIFLFGGIACVAYYEWKK